MSGIPKPVPVAELMAGHEFHGHELLPHIRKTPSVLYGIFVELVRQFYANPANHAIGVPPRVWSPDADATEIWIDTELRWEDEHPEKRPAIYIGLGPISYRSLTGRKDGLVGDDMAGSELFFSRSGSCVVSFTHIGSSSGEACTLGDSTADYLDAFGLAIRDDFCFTSFALSERVALRRRPVESTDRYDSVVACEVEFQDRWTLKVEAARLRSLTFRAGQAVADNVIVRW